MSEIHESLSLDNAALLGEQLFENSPDCMKLLDSEGRLLAMNRNGRLGMEIDDFEQVRGKSWAALWPRDARSAIAEAIEQARSGHTARLSAACPTAKGRLKWWDVTVSGLRGADGSVGHLVAVSHDTTGDRQAAIARLESRDRLRVATEAAKLGVWSWDPARDLVKWENARAGAIFGLADERGQIGVERLIGEFVHPDDAEAFRRAAQHTLQTDADLVFEGRIQRPDGQVVWVELFGRFQSAAAGRTRRVVGTVADITGRKLAAIELFDSRERFQKIVSQAATGVVQMDVEGRVTLVNQKFCAMLGHAEAELLGRSILDVTAPESIARTVAAVNGLVAHGGGVVVHKHYRRKDGSLMPATSSVNALMGASGECQGLVAIVLDATESTRAAEALRDSEQRYRTLFDSMDQAFCVVELLYDAEGRPADWVYLEANAAYSVHTGLSNVVGKTRSELIPGADRVFLEEVASVVRDGGNRHFERESRALGRWYDVYLTRVGGEGSNKVATLCRDISERKAAEDEQRRLAAGLAEADRRKSEFLATLAHELRNPLAPIRSGLGVLRLQRDASPVLTRVREMMDRQVDHMVRLIDDLLDIARISGGKLNLRTARVGLNGIVESAVETSLPAIEAARHALTVELPGEDLLIDADATRIAQVVANLLNNAAKYTPAGGRVRVAAHREGDEAVIVVCDTGVGIDRHALGAVFEMFSQVGSESERAQGGLGIGLSLVRQLVAMHGGSVVAESDGAGHGSRFTVRLPLADPGRAPAEAQAAAPALAAARAGLKVMVVDDNVDAAVTLAMILDAGGHATRVAHSGHEALALAPVFRPDLVFLDIGMPGMDGYETAVALRRLPGMAHTVLAALTGWGAEHDRARSKEAGFDHHLTKPVELGTVEALLEGIGRDRP